MKNEYDGKRMQKKEMYRCKRGDESEKNNCLAEFSYGKSIDGFPRPFVPILSNFFKEH